MIPPYAAVEVVIVKPEAAEELVPFLLKCGEGATDFLYLDVKGNVTIGVGVLLPDVVAAMRLDWVDAETGAPAGADDVAQAWRNVIARQDLRLHGGGAYRGVTHIRATSDSLESMMTQKAAGFEGILRGIFPGYDDAPWQAQLGLMRMAWAMGPSFAAGGRWPHFRAAWTAGDWQMCGIESRIPELDAVEPTANAALRALFASAAAQDE